MNKIIIAVLLLQLSFLADAQHQTRANAKGPGFYLNRIFAGDYPDPSLLRDGDESLEVSALHHNVLGGFLSLRIGLCSIGDGVVKFKNFRYKLL